MSQKIESDLTQSIGVQANYTNKRFCSNNITMKNNYFPSSMDLDIFLEGNEVEEMMQYPIEGELTERGEPLGKKLIIKYEDFYALGDGIEVKYIKTDPGGGFDEVTAIEVLLNEHAYSRLKQTNRTGSRHGLGAIITIHGPGALGF